MDLNWDNLRSLCSALSLKQTPSIDYATTWSDRAITSLVPISRSASFVCTSYMYAIIQSTVCAFNRGLGYIDCLSV